MYQKRVNRQGNEKGKNKEEYWKYGDQLESVLIWSLSVMY
jgi:hypothetical protein